MSRIPQIALVARVLAGTTIAAFGIGKFTHHGAETAALDRYGVPFADPTTYLVGLVEVVGGLLLVLGVLVRPAALVLAGNFVVAIATAGRIEGGPIHLGLAPALLATMVFLLWSGPGTRALGDRGARVVLRLVPLAVVVGAFAVVGAADTERMAAAAELPAAQPSAAPTVEAAARRPGLTIHESRYGRILSDGRGVALYAFTRDPRGGKSTCYADCARAWPPYIVKARPGAGSGVRGALSGTVRRADGRLQATYNGRPLYYYVGDRQPGIVLCQDVFEYGGTWLVVRGTGALVR
jgi:predicted lipoprotein with Yx(FWY)xxD motif/uncharacterized membrane protein YphA (DoxX/SURF4 family)